MIESLTRDVRHGVRVLLNSYGFSLSVVVILGLGIGANAAIFAVVNAVVLRPLPYPESSRIVRVWHTPPREQFSGRTTFAVSPANYLDWHAQSTSFEHMAIVGFRPANLTGRGEPDALRAAVVSGEFFQVLGAPATLGRVLGAGDEDPSHAHVVVIGEHIWKSRFGSDSTIVGQTITLNGEAYTVVGVLADRLRLPSFADVWMPLVWTPQERAVRGNHNYFVIARLRPDTDLQRAQTDMSTISRRLEQLYPADDKGWGALVVALQQDLVADVRWGLLVLLGAVVCVLLIACANLANLLLARVLGRAREIAIRAAIGASRGRVIQQLLVEGMLLSVAGGVFGLFTATWGLDLLVKLFGPTLPRASEISIDGRVLVFTSLVAVLTGLIAGVAPAWRMTRGDACQALKQGMGRGGTHAGERRVRNVLVTTEVALALMLLVGAGLLIRTLGQLRAIDPGIDPRNVVTMRVNVPRSKYPEPGQLRAVFTETLRRVRALPGVESVATIDVLPLAGGGSIQPVAIEGEAVRSLSDQPEVAVRVVSPAYLSAVRMRVVDGRDFTEADAPGRPLAVLVSASIARRFWPNQRPIGQHLTLGLISGEPREVVGVVSDVKLQLNSSDSQTIYVPFTQAPFFGASLVVRTTVPPQTIVPSVIAAVHAIDPEQPVVNIQTLDDVIGESIAQQRFAMQLLTAFATLALLLAAVGIYAVLSYTVRQRVHEIGIRMALGAKRTDVVGMVLVEGLRPTMIGLAIGVAGAAALGDVLNSLVFGVTPRDMATFATVSVVVLAVGLLSSLGPAYRATRVDPLQALRAD
jgi:putative ABC transport system permease protein